MRIENRFTFGQIVYLKTDREQSQRIVVSIQVNDSSVLLYRLCCGTSDSWHFEYEITAERDIIIATSS